MKFVQQNSNFQKILLNRFLRYVKICTTSDSKKADAGFFPSTDEQKEFARILNDELVSLGFQNVQITEKSYVYGILPATDGLESVEPFCLLSHMDTSEEVSGENVNPQVFEKYDGKKIFLNGIKLDPASDENLAKTSNTDDTIITSDGTTLLGADDKAGLSEIITALQYIHENKIPHGPVEVIFSPDEETGHGMDFVPQNLLKSKHAYTVDGGNLGELETECFNAKGATVTFKGKSTHTGTARSGKMINAIMMASKFVENLPHNELPETTDGYEGFYAVLEMNGTIEKSEIYLLLRDFTEKGMENRCSFIENLAEFIKNQSGGNVSVEFKQQYKNMKENLDKVPHVTETLKKAFSLSEVVPEFSPIRGGTDGSRLTEMGIPCPNIFTGGHNFHSRYEWASLNQMTDAVNVLINLVILHKEL